MSIDTCKLCSRPPSTLGVPVHKSTRILLEGSAEWSEYMERHAQTVQQALKHIKAPQRTAKEKHRTWLHVRTLTCIATPSFHALKQGDTKHAALAKLTGNLLWVRHTPGGRAGRGLRLLLVRINVHGLRARRGVHSWPCATFDWTEQNLHQQWAGCSTQSMGEGLSDLAPHLPGHHYCASKFDTHKLHSLAGSAADR
eukprot:1148772-Pelagomonas_calceolata.AAC.3